MKNNAATMTTLFTRLDEYSTQRGMRWMSNFTLNSTLARMPASEGYEYLRRKHLSNQAYMNGLSSASHSDLEGESL